MKIPIPIQGFSSIFTGEQPAGHTKLLKNVRPRSVENEALVLGQRPGLKKSYSDNLEVSSPVRAMCEVTVSNETNPEQYEKILVVVAGGEVHARINGSFQQIGSNDIIDTSKPVDIAEAYQKAFIVNGSTKKVVDLANIKLTAASSITVIPEPGDVLTQDVDGGTAKLVVDFVDSARTNIYGRQISDVAFDSSDASPVQDLIGTGDDFDLDSTTDNPFIFDWTTYPDIGKDQDDITYGELPDKATVVCLYMGRIALSGNPDYPHQWYMLRANNPFDCKYYSNDMLTAVVGSDADVGKIGDVVIAEIPFGDDFQIYGCASSMWKLSGPPVPEAGGTLNPLSDDVGIWGRDAWCRDNKGNLYFLGTDGLYLIGSNVNSRPVNLTYNVVPDFMDRLDLDRNNDVVVLSYDPYRNGVLISKTEPDGTNTNYWYDLNMGEGATGGLFPEEYPADCGITSKCKLPDEKKLLLGCSDGYIREFDDDTKDDAKSDTTSAIGSYVLCGPVRLLRDYEKKAKTNRQEILFYGDSITYGLVAGETAKEVIDNAEASADITGTVSQEGRNKKMNRLQARFLGVFLSNDETSETWQIERIDCRIKSAGKVR